VNFVAVLELMDGNQAGKAVTFLGRKTRRNA